MLVWCDLSEVIGLIIASSSFLGTMDPLFERQNIASFHIHIVNWLWRQTETSSLFLKLLNPPLSMWESSIWLSSWKSYGQCYSMIRTLSPSRVAKQKAHSISLWQSLVMSAPCNLCHDFVFLSSASILLSGKVTLDAIHFSSGVHLNGSIWTSTELQGNLTYSEDEGLKSHINVTEKPQEILNIS